MKKIERPRIAIISNMPTATAYLAESFTPAITIVEARMETIRVRYRG